MELGPGHVKAWIHRQARGARLGTAHSEVEMLSCQKGNRA
jgi:hypothetical protein